MRTFAHSEFAEEKYSSPEVIKSKIEARTDLFGRGHVYKKIKIDNTFPKYLLNNLDKFQKFIV